MFLLFLKYFFYSKSDILLLNESFLIVKTQKLFFLLASVTFEIGETDEGITFREMDAMVGS